MMRDAICFICISLLYSCGCSEGAFRSTCRRDSLMKATDRNRKLQRTPQDIIGEEHASSLPICVRNCARMENCRSINYKVSSSTSEMNCQFMAITKNTSSAVLSNANGWIHYEQIIQVGPRCRLVQCATGLQCNETCSTSQGYECVDVDECLSNPCVNGGTCSNEVDKYSCTCPPGYRGTNCQTDINECSSSPCMNGGTCDDKINQYTCSCAPGYEGSRCDTDINECSSSPCMNGGTCDDKINQYTCSCAPGYEGSRCETDINECSSSPCMNGGTCDDKINQYTCSCAPGYEGSRCETDINECSSSPCMNGGTCDDKINQYTCSCAPGYEGSRCETDINECSSSPCMNGGTCDDKVNQYTCSCAPGYEGSRCETDTNECSSSPCSNGGTCTDGINSYTCTCTGSYSGTRCSIPILASCKELYANGYRSNGAYTIKDSYGSPYNVYCDLNDGGWTLIARFSNADAKNWGAISGSYWYDTSATGSATTPSVNADMISKAFYSIKGNDLKVTKSDDSSHSYRLYAPNCLSSDTFREKITSYGNFRDNAPWFSSNNQCRGSCSVSWNNAAGVAGFSKYACSSNLRSANYLSFWCHYSTGDGAVMMIGGGGEACARADHGIAITESNSPKFDTGDGRYDFGDDALKSQTTSYALNLWIR